MHGYLSGYIICFEKRTVPKAKLNCELRGTDNVQGQYPYIFFKLNEGYCVYFPSNIFSLLAFKNISSLFKTISYIQFSYIFERKSERANVKQILKTGEYHLGNIGHRIFPSFGVVT